MSNHANAGSPEWVPLTPEIFDRLYDCYCGWIDDLTEIRERMGALRKAVSNGWVADKISHRNLNRLNANDKLIALKQMDVARTVLTCAEFEARLFLPGDPNERFIAGMNAVGEARRPTAEQTEALRRGMLEGRIPWPVGSERQMLRAILVDMLESKKARH
ncbi:hypothetical protein [Bradyrhizobium sp. McL0616]|uniref:hypothetical protein n=1 Tax=Bradyrhizobium sp. McL0616 TaxID=3415674 RepID=UPI003CF1BB83